MEILILAGGLGTRLRGIVDDKPKPMAKVAGKPFLEYLILYLKSQGFDELILSTGYLAEQVQNYFKDGSWLGVNIAYSEEPEQLGTGGAIQYAENLIEGDNFLVLNGDSFLQSNLNKLTQFHKRKSAIASLALVKTGQPDRYGRVELGSEKRITCFAEKKGRADSGFINGGIYVFNQEFFSIIPSSERASLENDILPRLIGNKFYGLPFDGYFVDIGTPESLKNLRNNPEILKKKIEEAD